MGIDLLRAKKIQEIVCAIKEINTISEGSILLDKYFFDNEKFDLLRTYLPKYELTERDLLQHHLDDVCLHSSTNDILFLDQDISIRIFSLNPSFSIQIIELRILDLQKSYLASHELLIKYLEHVIDYLQEVG